jgi:GDP-D-mannose dehydratase
MGAFRLQESLRFLGREKPTRFYQASISMVAFDLEQAQKYGRLKTQGYTVSISRE